MWKVTFALVVMVFLAMMATGMALPGCTTPNIGGGVTEITGNLDTLEMETTNSDLGKGWGTMLIVLICGMMAFGAAGWALPAPSPKIKLFMWGVCVACVIAAFIFASKISL